MYSVPKISVIMSVYNGQPFIKEAVESILSQTHKNFEFIIVDDGSTDSTLKYLKHVKDKRIIIIKNSKNLGLSASLNKAINKSKSEYITRMDADDISYPRRLETQLNFLQKNKKVDLCGSYATLINENGKVVGTNKRNPLEDKKIKKMLGIYPTIIHPTFFCKRKFFIDSDGYSKEFDGAEDYELLCRVKNKFTYANVPKELLYWRLRDDRRSMQMMKKMYALDLKIKRKNLAYEGANIYNLYGIGKMVVLHYLIPLPIKRKIARLLKFA